MYYVDGDKALSRDQCFSPVRNTFCRLSLYVFVVVGFDYKYGVFVFVFVFMIHFLIIVCWLGYIPHNSFFLSLMFYENITAILVILCVTILDLPEVHGSQTGLGLFRGAPNWSTTVSGSP